MRIYKTKVFNRIAAKDVEISDEALKEAGEERAFSKNSFPVF